jgi:flagellar protein FliO/FliZ
VDNVLLALRVVVSLGVVIGAIWFVQRRVTRAGGKKSSVKPISVIARQNLGAKASIAVVEFAGKRFLLGVTEHGVSVLDNGSNVPAEVAAETPTAVVAPAPKPARKKPAAREFGEVLGAAESAAANESAPEIQLVSDGDVEAAFTPTTSKLAGSILSASTWKQAYVALRGGR